MSDAEELTPAGRTETTVRRFDKQGTLIEESVTTITHHEKPTDETLPIGQYL